MSKPILAVALIALTLGGCAATSPTRILAPEAAKSNSLNGAYFVMEGPYSDDCWMYGWCTPNGKLPNIAASHRTFRRSSCHTHHNVQASRCVTP